MPITCNRNTLEAGGQAFVGLSRRALQKIQTSVLCSITNVGGFGTNLVPSNSTYTGVLAEFDLTVLPSVNYIIVWGSNDLYMILCGTRFDSPGVGGTTILNTGACTVMQFFGTFAGTTVTARVKRFNGVTLPVPSGFAQAINAAGTQVTYSWNNPNLVFVTGTEVWTSTDGINYTRNTTVSFPTASAVISTPAIGTTLYTKIRYTNFSTQFGDYTTPLTTDGRVADWIKRVNTNGGAMPSSLTIDALSDFVLDMRAASLEAKMIAMIPLVPDNLIAAITPLYKAAGLDPWTNNGPFVAGDLTVDGLLGNGTTKFLDTGINPSVVFNLGAGPLGGLTIYTVTALKDTVGFPDAGVQNGSGNNAFDLYLNNNGVLQFACYNQTTDRLQITMASPFAGFHSANSIFGNGRHVYTASSTKVFSDIGSLAGPIGGTLPAGNLVFHGVRIIAVLNNGGPLRRHSFDAIHNGYTSAEAQNLFNAAQKYRKALGGGFV